MNRVALLAGGTGGAKLAAGMQELIGEGLSVIANTADDIEVLGVQEFLILEGGDPPVEGIELDGIGEARPTPEALGALSTADAIVIGPSNPVLSIGPILAVPGMRDAIASAPAPVVAVSPFVAGRALKGPTEELMVALGRPATAAGVASLYKGLLDGMICDEGDPDPPPSKPPTLSCPTLMEGDAGRRELARRTLDFAASLSTR